MKRLTNLFSAPVKSLSKNIKKTGGVIGLASIISFASPSNAQTVIYDSETNKFKVIESADKISALGVRDDIYNIWVNPENTTNCYASGDLNQDGLINEEDVELINNTKNEYSDLNYNGDFSDPEDKAILNEMVYHGKQHPATRWSLTTREEKLNAVKKAFLLGDYAKIYWDKVHSDWDKYGIGISDWNCQQATALQYVPLNGFKKYNPDDPDIPNELNIDNGKFNLSMLEVTIAVPNHEDHSTIGVHLGGDPRNFDNYVIFESQEAGRRGSVEEVTPGSSWTMPKDCYVLFGKIYKFGEKDIDTINPIYLTAFDIQDGFATFDWKSERLITEKPIEDPITYVEEQKPFEYTTINNPNPFNGSTIITYNVEKPSEIVLDIYNIQGQKLETLVNDYQQQGEHTAQWNPKGLASGNYYYTIKNKSLPNRIQKGKMMLLK